MPSGRSLARALSLAAAAALALASCKSAKQSRRLLLVSTTSTQDSGLFSRLIPAAEKATGRRIDVICLGSGEALAHAEKGDADVVLTHAPAAEEAVEKEGHVVDRKPLMWNRFLLVGPKDDPAKVRDAKVDPVEAFRRIRSSGALFVSRGDESGTHKKEKEIWAAAKLPPADPHVLATGQGQGETIIVASQKSGYALCDTSTWTKMHPTGLAVVMDPAETPAPKGGPTLVNPYHVMRENPALHPETDALGSKQLEDWLFSDEARAIVTSGGLFNWGAPPG